MEAWLTRKRREELEGVVVGVQFVEDEWIVNATKPRYDAKTKEWEIHIRTETGAAPDAVREPRARRSGAWLHESII